MENEKKCRICIGNATTDVKYSTEEQKKMMEECARELNLEFNKIVIANNKRTSNIIVLFFLLLRTITEINQYKTGSVDINQAFKEFFAYITGHEKDDELCNRMILANIVEYSKLKDIKSNNPVKPFTLNQEEVGDCIDKLFYFVKKKVEDIL